jgi:class 3 adenylate cyclase
MGVHTGEVHEVHGEPVGLAVHHGARVMAAAEPGQVLVSAQAAVAVRRAGVGRIGGVSVRDAGWHVLRDHAGPVRLRQVVADGLTVVEPQPRRDRTRGHRSRRRDPGAAGRAPGPRSVA